MPLLRANLPAIETSTWTVGMQSPRLPAAPPRRLSPPENRRGFRIPPGMPGQSPEMALPQPRLLAALSPAAPSRGRAQPPTTAGSGPKTAPARSLDQPRIGIDNTLGAPTCDRRPLRIAHPILHQLGLSSLAP